MKSRLDIVVSLLHTAPWGVLATHSAAVSGYPYASALPFVTDEHHRPVFFISRLAEHTQNLAADPRASLLLAAPAGGDIQNAERASLVGRVTKIHDPGPLLLERYFRYQPEARDFQQLDFAFYRLEPARIRVIGGFGQAGWLDGNQLIDASPVALEHEAHALDQVGGKLPSGIRLLGLDAYGLDYVKDGRRLWEVFKSGAKNGEALVPAVLRLLQLKT